jgi:hypothetical protein
MRKLKTSIDIDIFSDEYVEEYQMAVAKSEKLKRLRRERPWVGDMIRVLWNRSLTSMQQLTDELWAMRSPAGLPMPRKFVHTVQSFLNQHTSQSTRWNGKTEDDLFYSPEGKGSGTWAVHHDTAEAWLKRHQLPEA